MKRIKTPRLKSVGDCKPLRPIQELLTVDEAEAARQAAETEEETRREDAYMAQPGHRTIEVRTVSQNQATAYFERSGALQQSHLGSFPVLVFTQPGPMTVRVELVHRMKALLAYDEKTPCMAPWPGDQRITWVDFTVGQLKAWLKEKDRVL